MNIPPYFLDNIGVDSIVQVKFLDFQVYGYESFANDLIYFLLMCSRFEDLRTNFKSFIDYYHSEFTKILNHTYDK